MKHKYALDRLAISEIWPIQIETKFTQDEIKSLEEVRFILNKWQSMFPQSLFKRESSILINKLVDEMLWPTSHNGKFVHSIVLFKMSNLHYN
jgi:hypothetical protein